MNATKKMDECNHGKYHFEKLALTEDVDISVYKDAIDFAFENPDVKNIAISGAYGSGKSSILASYKKKNPDKKFVHISLAHFIPQKKQSISTPPQSNIPANKTDTMALEGKILNQLIHQLDARNIPQTNFRVKNTASLGSIFWNTIAFVALILCFLHLILSYTWINFVGTFEPSWLKSFLELFTTPFSFLCSGLIIFTICAVFIYSAVKAQRYNAVIRKLSLQGNEIELFEENNDSFFDKYLNEVLYLFENSGIDAIVFEDMDRYEMEAIFERLREVNTLVNIRLAKKKKDAIRFVFLLRDDIFISKDRTKFFDFIIPIVPVIDSSNSYDQLIEHLDRNNIKTKFSDEFLQGISFYIDDMRLLKNICNEYLIYHSRLGSIGLDPEKLLALITYKNIYPYDFGRLQNNLGYVHAVFANKENIIKSQRSTLENELKKTSLLAKEASDEDLKSKKEVMLVYAVAHLSEYTYSLRNMSESTLDTNIRRVLSREQIQEYEYRINRASSQRQSELHESCKELERSIISINGMHLYEIIPHEDGAKVLSEITHAEEGATQEYQEIKNSQYFDLLKYLILNGYLDESYPDYMTYFYPNSLTRKDKIFLRRVLDRNGHDYTYVIDNPRLVVSKLRVSDFDYVDVLNNSLLNYLLKNDYHSEKLQHMLAQIEKRRNFQFIRQFLESTPEREIFVQAFSNQWPGFFDDIVRKGELSPEEIRQYSIDTLYHCNEAQLSSVNIGGCLTGYIANCSDYLQISNPKIDKLIYAFMLLDVHFRSLNPDVSNRVLFEQVYQASLYSINIENINLMLKEMHGVAADNSELLSSNYSYICRFPESPLCHYIDRFIDDYMGVWLTTYQGIIYDEESDAIRLLNNEHVSERFKEAYILQLGITIGDINAIQDKQLWELLLKKKCVLHTEENAIAYWTLQNRLDPVLITYLNEFRDTISFTKCKELVSDAELKKFFVALVKCNSIQNRQYKECVTTLGFEWTDEFNISGLSVEKVEILAKNHILQMTPATLCYLRNNYTDAVCGYIENNYDEYTNIMTAQLMNQHELLMILKWNVSDESKKKLIDMAPSPISIIDSDYSPEISVYILHKKVNFGDIPLLYETYDSQPDPIKDYMYALAIKNIESIIRGTTKTTTELKCRVLNNDQVSDSVRQRLLVSAIKTLSKEDVLLCLDAAQKQEFSKIFNPRAKPKIGNDTHSKEILDNIKLRGWIAGYSMNEAGNGYEIQKSATSKKKMLTYV